MKKGRPESTLILVAGFAVAKLIFHTIINGRARLEQLFESVVVAGRVPNPLGVDNEESHRPYIYICRRPREPWSSLWPKLRAFG